MFDWEEALSYLRPDEAWWYSPSDNGDDCVREKEEWRPFGEGQFYAVPGEPESAFTARMGRADDWFNRRHEKTIAVITHWGVVRHWTGEEIENGGVCRIEWKVAA